VAEDDVGQLDRRVAPTANQARFRLAPDSSSAPVSMGSTHRRNRAPRARATWESPGQHARKDQDDTHVKANSKMAPTVMSRVPSPTLIVRLAPACLPRRRDMSAPSAWPLECRPLAGPTGNPGNDQARMLITDSSQWRKVSQSRAIVTNICRKRVPRIFTASFGHDQRPFLQRSKENPTPPGPEQHLYYTQARCLKIEQAAGQS
jgi:hypothetical protein